MHLSRTDESYAEATRPNVPEQVYIGPPVALYMCSFYAHHLLDRHERWLSTGAIKGPAPPPARFGNGVISLDIGHKDLHSIALR